MATWTNAGIAAVVVAHIACLALPFVNQEFAFFSGAKAFLLGDATLLRDLYFPFQANTLAVPLLAAGLSKLIPVVPINYAPRVVALLSLGLMAYSIALIVRVLWRKEFVPHCMLAVLANPLLWIYSSRGTADFIPLAIGTFCIALHVAGKRWWWSAMVGGAAMVTKYHAFVIPAFVMVLTLLDHHTAVRRRAGTVLAYAVVALAPVACYWTWTYCTFGFVIAPDQFRDIHGIHQLSVATFSNNLAIYLGFLYLVLMPPAIVVGSEVGAFRGPVWFYAWAGGLAAAGAMLLSPVGEMDLGPLSRYLPAFAISAICLTGTAFMIRTIWLLWRRADSRQRQIVVAAVVSTCSFLALLSLSRPAQRYLLLLVSIWLPVHLCGTTMEARRWAATATFYLSACLCLYVFAQQYATGSAAANMVNQLRQSGLIAETEAGAIEAHVMDAFVPRTGDLLFVVVDGRREGAIIVSDVHLIGPISKTYSLIKRN